MQKLIAFFLVLGLISLTCISLSESSDSAPEPELRYGDSSDDVLALQTRLKNLNYYTGELSSEYDEGTRRAIESFQKDFNLEVTGIADAQTQSVLFSVKYRVLRYGMQGDDVKALQERLTELGYYKGKLSGNFLEGTQNAVKKYQRDHSLDQTGIVDEQTASVLFSSASPSASDTSVDPEAHESQETAPKINLEHSLKNGSRGEDVKILQTRLAELGYYDGPVSGNFMAYTTKAVKAFQADFGLEQTGIADTQTLSLLFSSALQFSPESSRYTSPDAEVKEPMGIAFQRIPWNSTPEETVQILIDSGFIESSNIIRSKVTGLYHNPYSSLEESWFFYGSSKKEPYTYKHTKNDKTLSDKLKVFSIEGSNVLKTIGKQEIKELLFKFSLASGSPQLVELSITFNKESTQNSDALLSVLKSSFGEPSLTEKTKGGQKHYIWYGEYNTIVALDVGTHSSVYFASIDGLILSGSAEIPATKEPAPSPTPSPTPEPASTPVPTPEKEDTGF